jgi:hypothetical protein
LPPRDLAKAAFAVMVWASSKLSAEKPVNSYDWLATTPGGSVSLGRSAASRML